jgi:hypothetical protein
MKKILEKIKKLRRHAQSASETGSIAEAETATLLMNQLLTKYNLTLIDISDEDDKKTVEINRFRIIMQGSELGFNWIRDLFAVLCEFNYCALIGSKDGDFSIVGTEFNANVVNDLANRLSSVYLYHAIHTTGIPNSEKKIAAAQSCFCGCVSGLYTKLESEVATNTALTLYHREKIDDFLKKTGICGTEKIKETVETKYFNSGVKIGCSTDLYRTIEQQLNLFE